MDQGRHHTDESRTQMLRVPNPGQRAVTGEDVALWFLLALSLIVISALVLVAS